MASLLSPSERKARQAAKLLAALRFLRNVTYSSPELLGRAMGLHTSAGWYRALDQLEREEIISSAKVTLDSGRKLTLCGITAHGQALATARLDLAPTDCVFCT